MTQVQTPAFTSAYLGVESINYYNPDGQTLRKVPVKVDHSKS